MFTVLFQLIVVSVLTTLLLIANSHATLNNDLTVNFLKTKQIHFGYIFDCLSTRERIAFAKFLMGNQLRISENNIREYNPALINNKDSFFYHVGVIVDGDCVNVDYLLKQAEESMLFDDVQHWLIVASSDNILTNFLNLTLNINTNLYVAIPNKHHENAQNWTIIDVYNPAYKQGGELKIETIGFYNKNQGFQLKRMGNKYWIRRNMTGVTFKGMMVWKQPIQGTLEHFLYHDDDRRTDTFAKFQFKLTYYCQELYNFTLQMNLTENWGYQYSKGKFDGLSGYLQRKEIDIGCTALYYKPERIPVMDYAIGLWIFRDIFFFRQPNTRSFGHIFLNAMSLSAWLAILAAGLLIVIALKLTQKCEPNVLKTVKDSVDQKWSTVMLFTLGAFCQQGFPQSPVLFSARIVTLSILAFCLLFYQFYSGTVVSLLLTKPPAAIKTPKDLLDSTLRVGSHNTTYIKDYFRTTADPMAIEMHRRKILGPGNTSNYFPPEYGLKLVEKGGFAYQLEVIAGYIMIEETFSEKAICELGELEMFPKQRLMTPLPKNSPFRDLLNFCMHRLAEHGIGEYQKAFWGARKPECLESSRSLSIEVGLKEIYPAIVLLCIGFLTSLVVLGVEIFAIKRIREGSNKGFAKCRYPFVN